MYNLFFDSLILITLIFFVNFFLLKTNLLFDKTNISKHKKLLNKEKVPLSGGILILLTIFLLLKDINILSKLIFLLIFLLGLLSDIDKLKSSIIRIFLQTILVAILIFYNSTFVLSTKLFFIDFLLENYFLFKLFFTLFCFIILINGTNFIDGTNCLVSGYFIALFLNIIILISSLNLNVSMLEIYPFLTSLIVFFVFNFFSRSFLGDGGSYLIAAFTGILLINFVNNLPNLISPYYIILLLWYPAFENLFTICRRGIFEKNKVDNPDNYHLHHLIYLNLIKVFKKRSFCNTATGIFINVFNFIIMFVGSQYIGETKKLIYILFISVFFYILTYFYLKKKIKYIES